MRSDLGRARAQERQRRFRTPGEEMRAWRVREQPGWLAHLHASAFVAKHAVPHCFLDVPIVEYAL